MDDSAEIQFNLKHTEEETQNSSINVDEENDTVREGAGDAEGDALNQLGANALLHEVRQMKRYLLNEFKKMSEETQHQNETNQMQLARDISMIKHDLESELNLLKIRMSQQTSQNTLPSTESRHNLHTNATLQSHQNLAHSPLRERQSSPIRTGQQLASSVREVTPISNHQRSREHQSADTPAFENQNSNGSPGQRGVAQRKPQLFDGSDDLEDYLKQFQILSELNKWDCTTKSLHLASSLSGAARAILSELDERELRDYDSIVKALNKRYGSVQKAEIFRARLQTRVRGKEESIPELAQSIRKLTRQAYPSATTELHNILALDYFIDAIPDSEVRLRLREVHPKNLGEAEAQATRLEAYKLADKQRIRSVRSIEQQNDSNNQSNVNTVGENLSADPIKEICSTIKNEFNGMKKEFVSLTRELKNISSNVSRGNVPQQNQRNERNFRRSPNNGNDQRRVEHGSNLHGYHDNRRIFQGQDRASRRGSNFYNTFHENRYVYGTPCQGRSQGQSGGNYLGQTGNNTQGHHDVSDQDQNAVNQGNSQMSTSRPGGRQM